MSPLFEAQLQLVATQEGGRKTPFIVGYRPQFFIDPEGESTSCFIQEIVGGDFVRPGESAIIKAQLLRPEILSKQIVPGVHFSIREGKKLVGYGVIMSVSAVS